MGVSQKEISLSHPAAIRTEPYLQHFASRCEVGDKPELKSCGEKLDHPLDLLTFQVCSSSASLLLTTGIEIDCNCDLGGLVPV